MCLVVFGFVVVVVVVLLLLLLNRLGRNFAWFLHMQIAFMCHVYKNCCLHL